MADWGAILAYQAHVNGDVVLIDTVGQRAVLNIVEIGGRIKFDHRKNWKGKNAVAPPSFDMIDLQLSHIKGGADFRKVTVPNMLLINDTTIDGNLEFFGSTLKTVAANNLTVSGTFRIAPNEEHPVKWLKDSALVLPNANLTKFQIPDSESAWPSRTDLRNLGYREFDFVQTSVPEQTIIAVDAPVAQFSKWLSLSQPLSPQPYVQLAQELKTRGYEDYSKEIRITERERARAQTAGLDWVWETTKYYLIGHGYDLSGAWIAAASLLVLGRIVLLLSPIARRAGFGFAYSLDLLAPVIELRKRHFETELEPGIRRYYYVHRILGFIIASFLVAGITGLAKLG